MKRRYGMAMRWTMAVVLSAGMAAAQAAYKPKFPGDPARSDAEAAALGYMRTVLRAEKLYKKKNNHYATSLADLVHTGSFTRRMVNPDRGDYTVGFRAHEDKDTFELAMTPNETDAEHRALCGDEDGVVRASEE